MYSIPKNGWFLGMGMGGGKYAQVYFAIERALVASILGRDIHYSPSNKRADGRITKRRIWQSCCVLSATRLGASTSVSRCCAPFFGIEVDGRNPPFPYRRPNEGHVWIGAGIPKMLSLVLADAWRGNPKSNGVIETRSGITPALRKNP